MFAVYDYISIYLCKSVCSTCITMNDIIFYIFNTSLPLLTL